MDSVVRGALPESPLVLLAHAIVVGMLESRMGNVDDFPPHCGNPMGPVDVFRIPELLIERQTGPYGA